MAQDPFLVDQIQIEPGSGDTLLIRRATGGFLEFVDEQVPSITLKTLAGLSLGGLKLVSPTGVGATHSTIQAALDCIPATSGPTEPYVVLVGPGVYNETLNIVRDWVFLIGLGGVVLEPVETTPNGPGAYHTVVIQEDLGTVPEKVVLQNLTIRNYHNTYACVRIVGGASSEVGETGIGIVGCDLEATASGGNRPVWVTSSNHIFVKGGDHSNCVATSQTLVEECASFTMEGVKDVSGIQLDYDTTGTLPNVVGSSYRISNCLDIGLSSSLSPPIRSTLSGAGSFSLLNCGRSGDVTLGGDRSCTIVGTDIGDLTINDTVSVSMGSGGHGTISAGVGTTFVEPLQQGVVSFAASSSESVSFTAAHPDADYMVSLEVSAAPSGQEVPWISAKIASGFQINFTSAQTLDVRWAVHSNI